jgi:hypothetical protein
LLPAALLLTAGRTIAVALVSLARLRALVPLIPLLTALLSLIALTLSRIVLFSHGVSL